jgi:hypothetical protein
MILKSFWFKFSIALLLVGFLPATAMAASVTLRWQHNQENDISGYNVYYGTSSRNYRAPIPVGNTTSYEVDNLSEGMRYYFTVTATDTSGNESGYSSEVTVTANANLNDSIENTPDYPNSIRLSTNESSPVSSGNVVELIAQASGGTNLEYRFWIGQISSISRVWQWEMVQDYSPNNTFRWNTNGYEGQYLLQADVRNFGSTESYQQYDRISGFAVY